MVSETLRKILSCVDSKTYDLDDFYDENWHMDYIERLTWYISMWNFAHQTKIRAGKKLCLSMTLFMWLCNKVEDSSTDELTITQRLPEGFHDRYKHETFGNIVSIKDASLNISLSTLRGTEWMLYSSIRPIPEVLANQLNENMMLLFRHFAFFLKGKHPATMFNRFLPDGTSEFGVEWIQAEHEDSDEEEEEKVYSEQDRGKKKKKMSKKEEEEEEEESSSEEERELTEEERIEMNMKLLWSVPDDADLVIDVKEKYNEKGEVIPEEPEKVYEANWKLLFMLDTRYAFFFACHYQYHLTKDIPSEIIIDHDLYVKRVIGQISGTSEDDLVKHRHEFMLKRIVPYSQIRLYNYFVPFTPDDLDTIPIREPLLWEERSDVTMEEVTFHTFDGMMSPSVDVHEKTLTIDSFLSYYTKNSMDQVNGRSVVDVIYRKTVFMSMDEFPFIAIEYYTNRYILYFSQTDFYCFDSLLDAFCYIIFMKNMNIFKVSRGNTRKDWEEKEEYTLNLTQLRTCLSTDSTNWDQTQKRKKRKRNGRDVTTL